MEIKKLLAENIKNIDIDFENLICETQDKKMGDYSLPCFTLAKQLHKSPIDIANDIKENFNKTDLIERIEVVNGYVNFFLNKQEFVKLALEKAMQKDFYSSNENNGKRICIDYSSVNMAKYMHIGHLSTTMIGESLARIYSAHGYNIVRINYIGDYGTPFGKMMHAYLNWGNEDELNTRGIDYLQQLYVEFCAKAENDKTLEQSAREYFKKIEEKDEKIYPIYQKFIEISKKEAKDILDTLGVQFDSWKGEASYTDLMPQTIEILKDKNLLTKSEGAEIVDLSEYNKGVCMILKSDGATSYATRDITAAIDRYNEYHFDKMLYVTAVQQKLHFEQFFKVLELAGFEFSKNLQHIYYGMFSLPTGKIASRKGKQAVLRDLMEYAYNKAYDILKDRTFNIENKEDVAKKVAMSALKFNALKNERIKDAVFDIENCFNFDGDTSAYMQYTYARISSILRKANIENFENIDYSYLNSQETFNLLFEINNYKNYLKKAMEQNEPSVLSKYALEMCKLTNKFYMNEKVLSDNQESTKARALVLKTVKQTLAHLFHLICLDTIEEM